MIWAVLLTLLLKYDPAQKHGTSTALWLPVLWLFLAGSRLPSQWISGTAGTLSAQSMEEGNPLDRMVFLVLILLSIAVLVRRSFNWERFIVQNMALIALLGFALLSVCWSDYPFIAFKRWFRDLGNYWAVLVVISDKQPLEAIRAVLRRLSYLLVPLSILLIKYFPQLSNTYDPWTGVRMVSGAATSKNMLGTIFLVCGIFFFWDSLMRWPERKQKRTKRILLVNAAFIGMTWWLVNNAESTTSEVCLVLGCLVIAATRTKIFKRHPGWLKMMVPSAFILYLILDFGLGMNGSMAQAVGKDPSLTDRTKIWAFLLSMHTNPLIGTGYQSFWLGPRLDYFWLYSGLGHLNEAHNGYLEIYLEMGLAGDTVLAIFLIAGYRAICRSLDSGSALAVLGLAVWMVLAFYNMTEAAFEGGLLYTIFLITTIHFPAFRREGLRRSSIYERTETPEAYTARVG